MHLGVAVVALFMFTLFAFNHGCWLFYGLVMGLLVAMTVAAQFRGAMVTIPILYHIFGVVEDIANKLKCQFLNKGRRRTTEFMLVYFCLVYYLFTKILGLCLYHTSVLIGFAMLPVLVIIRNRFELPAPDVLCSKILWGYLDTLDAGMMVGYANFKYFYDKYIKDPQKREMIAKMNLDDPEAMGAIESVMDDGEFGICAGVCMEIPCCDPIAPNTSGCTCLCPPTYDVTTYSVQKDGSYCATSEAHTPSAFFEQIMPQLHTGDIYLGAYPRPFAKTANFMLHSQWTHAGVIYRRSDCPTILTTPLKNTDEAPGDPSRPLIAEVLDYGEGGSGDAACPSFTLHDFETSALEYLSRKQGLEFESEEEKKKCPPFLIAVRRLLNPDGTPFTRTNEFYQNVEKAISKTMPKSYRMNPEALAVNLCQFTIPYFKKLGIACSAFEAFAVSGVSQEDKDGVFCGEFVADVLKETGLLENYVNTDEYSPPCMDSSRHLNVVGAKLSCEYTVIGIDGAPDASRPEWGGRFKVGQDGDISLDPKKGPVQQQMDYQPPPLN